MLLGERMRSMIPERSAIRALESLEMIVRDDDTTYQDE